MKRRTILAGVVLLVGMARGVSAELPSDLYTTQTNTATSTSAQTDTTLWDPAAGKRFILQGVMACTDLPVQVEFEVSDADVVPPMYFESYGCQTVQAGGAAIYMSARDAVLTYTTTALFDYNGNGIGDYSRVSVMAWGYEIE